MTKWHGNGFTSWRSTTIMEWQPGEAPAAQITPFLDRICHLLSCRTTEIHATLRVRATSGPHDDAGQYTQELTMCRHLDRYYCLSRMKNMVEFMKIYANCQMNAQNVAAASLGKWIVIEHFEVSPWDFSEPLFHNCDCRYMLVVVDYSICWMQVELIKSADNYMTWRCSSLLLTDLVWPWFDSRSSKSIKARSLQQRAAEYGVHSVLSLGYIPRSDGLVEETNKQILERLRRATTRDASQWAKLLWSGGFSEYTRFIRMI